ncbi:basic proline-rich protein-like [Aquila chrysaetos chrysaetos]|uniref:basic proline-rich protein-like n=1 Tax=Aquila chrysaetos chrysaetos TaxID=223781 RepID=UPI001176D097|nr:basic proline-rich protein-like [Aquila chrysaetos chrysaetos]
MTGVSSTPDGSQKLTRKYKIKPPVLNVTLKDYSCADLPTQTTAKPQPARLPLTDHGDTSSERPARTRPPQHPPPPGPCPLLPRTRGARPDPPPAGLIATGLAPSAHPAAPGQAAASRPGRPKGGGAPGQLPQHQSGLARGSGGAAIPTAGPHRLSSSLRLSGTRRLSSARSPLPALPAPSPLSRNASFNSQPRPLPMQQERGQTCSLPAALDPPPRLPATAARLGLREPRMRGHRRPAAPGLRAVPSWGGGQEGGLQTPLPALPARAAQQRPPPAHTHPRSWCSAVPCYGRHSDSSPAEPGGAEKSILRPWRRAAAEARFPNKRLEEAILLPGLTQRPGGAQRGNLFHQPPARSKSGGSPAGCSSALQAGGGGGAAPHPSAQGGTGEAPETAPVNGEGADAELPLGKAGSSGSPASSTRSSRAGRALRASRPHSQNPPGGPSPAAHGGGVTYSTRQAENSQVAESRRRSAAERRPPPREASRLSTRAGREQTEVGALRSALLRSPPRGRAAPAAAVALPARGRLPPALPPARLPPPANAGRGEEPALTICCEAPPPSAAASLAGGLPPKHPAEEVGSQEKALGPPAGALCPSRPQGPPPLPASPPPLASGSPPPRPLRTGAPHLSALLSAPSTPFPRSTPQIPP